MAVKDFKPQSGDAAYTIGIVDLLLECVELSYRPGKSIDFLPFICISSKKRWFGSKFSLLMYMFSLER